MKLSLNWLSEHVDLRGLDPPRIAEQLTLRTALIEGFVDQRAALAGVVVGRVVERRKHPGADRLSLCRVEHGGERPAEVVCGAPNVAAGQTIAYAPVGVTLPNGVKLKAARIRGELSEGMICAEDELGLGPEHDGILVLPDGLSTGEPFAAAGGLADVVLDIDNKSITHRPDLWGHRGFARELAAIFGRELRPLGVDASLASLDAGSGAADVEAGPAVVRSAASSCPAYAGLRVEDEPSRTPDAMRFRLIACGLRPRGLLVDLSNYVMLELGQPTHPFDLDRLVGGVIEVRAAREGEELVTLDGVRRELVPGDLVIADGERAVALAGLLGGESSEVSEGTRRVFLESACFDPVVVRRTSSRLGLRTEASARFEKGLDPEGVELALRRYAFLLRRLRPGARLAAGYRCSGAATAPVRRIELPVGLVGSRLGIPLAVGEITDTLLSVGFDVEPGEGTLSVGVPSWRAGRDVTLPEDLVEEVGRLAGYDRVPSRVPAGALRSARRDPRLAVEEGLRDGLSRAGLTETMAYSMVPDAVLEAAGCASLERLPRLANPLQQDAARLRPALAPMMLSRLESWLRQEERVGVFEVGRGYRLDPECETGIAESREVVALLAWREPREAREVVRSLAGVADVALGELGVLGSRREAWEPDAGSPWLHPRRSARVTLESAGALARLGAVDPGVLARYGLRGGAGFVCFDVDALAAAPASGVRFRPMSRFPEARIDLAFVLPYELTVASVEEAILTAGPRTLRVATPFDVYRGAPLAEGERSVAYHLVFQADERTLTTEEVDKARDRIVATVERLGGRLR